MTEGPEKTKVLRRLAAILAADIAGYSTLMSTDEAGTVRDLKGHQAVILPMITEHGGRIIDTAGDGILAEFSSVVNAAECAVAIQRTMAQRNAGGEETRRMHFRIGINQGDVVFDDTRIYGDGVNIAARLEAIAEPGGICISRKVYVEIIGKMRLAFIDVGEHQLKNIAQPVRVYRISGEQFSVPQVTVKPALALPDKPSIAVLPFTNMSGDPEQEYFADGMVEEIITALSRIHWLFVIARNSSFTYKGRAVDVKRVGKELGVLYVLEGSVRRVGNRVRITAQLLDATTGAHLWAENFDGTLDDVFQLQDNVASSVAGVIEPTLQAAEYRRSLRRPTNDLTAYDLYLRARADAEAWEREGVIRALALVERALGRDPNYGSALVVAIGCQCNIYVSVWTNDLEATRKEGIDLTRRALRVAADDPYVLANAAWALGLFGEDITAAVAVIDRSLQLNPSFARAWVRSGWLRLWAGHHDLGIKHFETSIRLSPRESRSGTYLGIGVGHFFARRSEKAAEMINASLQEKSTWAPTLRFMASCLAHMGRLKEAQEIVNRLRTVTPVVIPTADHWRIREDREYYLDGLRLAVGVSPEESAGH
jgi:TolB-like protein/class 3 adenylate cyclase